MFVSDYQLVQEPHQPGVSICCFAPGTREVSDIIRTPIPVSSELVALFNAAPYDDQAALQWGIRADARDTNWRLFRWLQASATMPAHMSPCARIIQELAERVHQAYSAYSRLGYGQRVTAARQRIKPTVSSTKNGQADGVTARPTTTEAP
jgi:hypothetical protein